MQLAGSFSASVVAVLFVTASGCDSTVLIESPDDAFQHGTGGAGGDGGGPGDEGGGATGGASPAFHDRCKTPQEIDLSRGSATVFADTTGASDEHASLTCESSHVAGSLDRGQLYYRVDALAGRTYEFALQTSFYGFLYVFPEAAGCTAAAIESACSSEGATGMVSGIVNPGSTGTSFFTPMTAGPIVLGVDSDTSEGPFRLDITLVD